MVRKSLFPGHESRPDIWPRRLVRERTEGIALVLFTACSWGLTWADPASAMAAELPGLALGFAVAVLFGLGTVMAKKQPIRMPPTSSVAWQALLGMVLVVSLAAFESPAFGRVIAGGWISVAYISTVPMTVAYLAWFPALRMVPATTAATTVLMSPVVGVIGSRVLLGETFGPRQIGGMTLSGVALAARR